MFLKQRPLNQRSPSQEGYTILEGLMAVIVVSVMLLAIGPVIAFSVGTRVQAKRVELATQAGKSYIDWVKAAPDANAIQGRAPKQTAITAPATGDLTSDCTSKDGYCTTTDKKLYCVNLDETAGCQTNSPVDMVVQPLITNGDATNPQKGYQMTVRVYRANSFAPGVTLQSPTKSDSLTTNALGNRGLPLVMMKTEVLPSDATFENLRDRLQGTP
ncbi:Putative Prepilin-type N-terminal cleavage/methylation domain protein [Planktothrix agardhii]|uniref:hormogonium polysaccharide secretion pseudopilin HpsB n=1 Tax=Planktothrix agardhii TaxID=1160 RepID=UPI0020A7F16A|nr:hormogonium polysaccharide secretion pseudopilin HpsB [Planktothrix agardhii]CAD5913331.1 Putative Prepilin-type N-terminal cleavage/methylation domain protein [Planktothrix agardhii]